MIKLLITHLFMPLVAAPVAHFEDPAHTYNAETTYRKEVAEPRRSL